MKIISTYINKFNIAKILVGIISFSLGAFSLNIDYKLLLLLMIMVFLGFVLKLDGTKLSLFGLIILIFLPPPNYLPFNIGPLNVNTITIGFMLIFVLLRQLKKNEEDNKLEDNKELSHLFILIMLLPFCMLLSLMNATYPLTTVYQVIRFMFTSFIVFFVVYSLVKQIHFQFIVNLLIYSVSIISILAIVEYCIGYNFIYNSILNIKLENLSQFRRIYRVYATTALPNVLAALIAAILPFLVFKISILKSNKMKIYYILLLLLNMTALLLTFSRMALISTVFTLLFILYLRRDKIKSTIFIVAAIVVVCVFLIPLIDQMPLYEKLMFRFNSDNVVESGSYWHRMYKLATAFLILKYHFFFGVGWGNYPLVSGNPLYVRMGDPVALPVFDNQYLQIIGETGFVGIILFIFVLSNFMIKFLKTLNHLDGENKIFLLAIMTSLCVVLINNLILEGFMWNSINILFWMLLALGSLVCRFSK